MKHLSQLCQVSAIFRLHSSADLCSSTLPPLPTNTYCGATHTVEQHILWSNTFSGLTVCTATPQDITKLFASPKCPTYVTCEFADNDCWYVTFDSEESTQKVSWFQPSTRQGAGIVRSQLILKYTHHCIVSQCVLCVLP